MESVPHRRERFSYNPLVFLEVGEGHTGQVEKTTHFRDQPDYKHSNFYLMVDIVDMTMLKCWMSLSSFRGR